MISGVGSGVTVSARFTKGGGGEVGVGDNVGVGVAVGVRVGVRVKVAVGVEVGGRVGAGVSLGAAVGVIVGVATRTMMLGLSAAAFNPNSTAILPRRRRMIKMRSRSIADSDDRFGTERVSIHLSHVLVDASVPGICLHNKIISQTGQPSNTREAR